MSDECACVLLLSLCHNQDNATTKRFTASPTCHLTPPWHYKHMNHLMSVIIEQKTGVKDFNTTAIAFVMSSTVLVYVLDFLTNRPAKIKDVYSM